MTAFLTGSRLYGQPTPESDVDLVIHMSPERAKKFMDALDPEMLPKHMTPEDRARYGLGDQITFRFGKLNLILCLTLTRTDAWLDATQRCERLANIAGRMPRKTSVELFQNTFRRRGLE